MVLTVRRQIHTFVPTSNEELVMPNTQNIRRYEETDIYSTGAVEHGIRKGHRLRAVALRDLFGRVRSSLSHR